MTDTTPEQIARAAALDFVQRLVPLWQSTLGGELLGLYLIGSLAHGGFSRRYSDVDMAAVTAAALSPPALDHVRAAASAVSPEWGAKLSVFWANRNFSIGRFPPLDRVDYLDHAVTLYEREPIRPPRPSLDDIRQYLRGAPFANWAERAQRFAAAAVLAPADRKAYLRTLLYPARFCYSYLTGRMSSNDEAVAFIGGRRLPGIDLASVEAALACRTAAADPDALFVLRGVLPAQVDACAAILAG
jgi:hypothetical protein